MSRTQYDTIEEEIYGKQAARQMERESECATSAERLQRYPWLRNTAPAAIAVPEPQPANPWEIKGRMKKVAQFMARLDRFADHQVTAAEVEAASPTMIAAMLAGETRKPSDATVAALADALLAREVR